MVVPSGHTSWVTSQARDRTSRASLPFRSRGIPLHLLRAAVDLTAQVQIHERSECPCAYTVHMYFVCTVLALSGYAAAVQMACLPQRHRVGWRRDGEDAARDHGRFFPGHLPGPCDDERKCNSSDSQNTGSHEPFY